jgi:hypothetical protein
VTSPESPSFGVGDKLQIAEELQQGDLVFFDPIEPGRVAVRVVRLGDLDGSHEALFRTYPGPDGPEFIPVQEPFNDILAWEKLRHLGAAAEDKGSNWGRFAIPMETLVIYAPEEDPPPGRKFEDIEMTAETRASLEGYLLLCSKIPPPPEPLRVLAGLRIQAGQIPEEGQDQILETIFAPGSTVELRGMLSSSAIAEPPLFAAGVHGAMLDILMSQGAYMSRITGFKREAEFALPMDCRCRVTSFEPSAPHEVAGGHSFIRPTIRLEQIE